MELMWKSTGASLQNYAMPYRTYGSCSDVSWPLFAIGARSHGYSDSLDGVAISFPWYKGE